MGRLIDGVLVTPQKRIQHPKGDIIQMMKSSEEGYVGFGEAYFSSVIYNTIKGWKRHRSMTLNLLVPTGEVRFVIYDDREKSSTYGGVMEVNLDHNNCSRLTIPPMLWVAFKGIGTGLNLILNIANIEHDPEEADYAELTDFLYSWV